jgi:hypothetical protein
MPQRTGLIAAVTSITLAAAAAAGGWLGGPAIAERATGVRTAWQPGTPPTSPPPVLVAAGDPALAPTPAGVDAALAPLARLPGLGSHAGISVVDVMGGEKLYGLLPDAAMVPAW